MNGRDFIVQEVSPALQANETVRWLIPARRDLPGGHQDYYAIAVTDRAVLVVPLTKAWPQGWPSWHRVDQLQVSRLPRTTRLGPIRGTAWILVDGRRYWVYGWRKDVKAADAELDQGG